MVARVPHHLLDAVGIRAWGPALLVVVGLVSGARVLARAPFILSRALRRAPGTTVALRRWAGAEVKVVLASVVVGAIASLPLYALLRATPAWWFFAWLLFAGVTVVWQVATPLVLRAQAGPLLPAPESLAGRTRALAARAGVHAGGDVAVAGKAGNRRCNAYVVGLGPTRRLVVEQAVSAWPPELVDQVVAHELGHWRLRHGAWRLPLALVLQLASLAAAAVLLSYPALLDWAGIASPGDPRSYPLLLLVGAAVAFPARCLLAWRDRAQERAADRFALALLDRPRDFAAMLDRVGEESGAARRLPWWRRLTASHPALDERAAACRVALSTGS